MKQLIIAEKPSLAKTIASALGHYQVKDGYFENEQYIISYAYGHLFGLYDLEDYTGESPSAWSLNNIPFIPDEYSFKLKDDKGVLKQYNILKDLASENQTSNIIHCGDADREGEVIVRLIIQSIFKDTGINKPVYRLWLPEQTGETIKKALNSMNPDSEYDMLFNEGLARTYTDWTYGINLTRLLTLKYGKKMPVGRVLVPIVKEVYDRCREIDDFVKTKYIQPESKTNIKGYDIVLTSKEKFAMADKSKAESYCTMLNSFKATVISSEKKEIEKSPGKLFSLTTLQNKLSKTHKLPMKESLEIIQVLYEKGYITYPRTNTEYLAVTERDKVSKIIELLNARGYDLALRDSKTIFDNSKVESHSAITPTEKIPDAGTLSTKENAVYQEIVKRFVCVFLREKAIIEKTILKIKTGTEEFTITGEAVKQQGFLKYEPQKDKYLPPLSKGDEISVNFIPAIKETSPPPKYTVTSLNNFLKAPFKKDDISSDDEDYKAMLSGVEIGTVATRTGIIENAKKYGYISEKNGVYSIEPNGIKLIEILDTLQIDMYKEKSAEVGRLLKQVYKQELSINQLCAALKTEVTSMVNTAKAIECDKAAAPIKEVIGKCPRCGKPVYEGQKNYYCSGYKEGCNFSFFKDNKFFAVFGKTITKRTASALLKEKRCHMTGLKSKAGSKFDADILVEWLEPYPKFQLDFSNNKRSDNKWNK